MRLFLLRRLSLVIFALIYSIGSAGIALHAHFCKGEFYSVELAYGSDQAECGCQKKSAPCCKDVTGFFAVEDDQHGGVGCTIPHHNPTAHDIFHARAFGIRILLPVRVCSISADDPPKEFATPTYLMNRNLRN